MSDFDPYNKWFGIQKNEAFPTFYQVLGLSSGESDPDVIASAAEQRLLFLKSVQNGPERVIAERLSKEVMNARSNLLDPEKKAVYDSQLPSQEAIFSISQPPLISQPTISPQSNSPTSSNPETESPQPGVVLTKQTNRSNELDHPDIVASELDEPNLEQPDLADSRTDPAMPIPDHLNIRPIPQLPPTSNLPANTNTIGELETSNDVSVEVIGKTPTDVGVTISPTRRPQLKRGFQNTTIQIAMFFVPTLLLIIFFTVFPQSFQDLVDRIREMAFGNESQHSVN